MEDKNEEKDQKVKEKKDNPTATFYVGKSEEAKATVEKFKDNMLKRGKKYSPQLIELMAKENARLENIGSSEVATFNLKQLKERGSKLRGKMKAHKKNVDAAFEAIMTLARKKYPLEIENIPLIINELRGYPIQREDHFNRGDTEEFIMYLEAWRDHEKILNEIDAYSDAKTKAEAEPKRVKPKAKESKDAKDAKKSSNEKESQKKQRRYIPPEELCDCGRYETFAEHNARCLKAIDEIERHNKEVMLDPLNLIRSIANYKWHIPLHEDQKRVLHSYLKKHNLPIPRYPKVPWYVELTDSEKEILKAHYKEHEQEETDRYQEFEKRLKQIYGD